MNIDIEKFLYGLDFAKIMPSLPDILNKELMEENENNKIIKVNNS